MDTAEKTERAHLRAQLENANLEYAAPAAGLARLFRRRVATGRIVDLGKSGVRFRATENLGQGKRLLLTLHLPGSEVCARVEAVVRWSRPETWSEDESYTHVIGAEITSYKSGALAMLQDALK